MKHLIVKNSKTAPLLPRMMADSRFREFGTYPKISLAPLEKVADSGVYTLNTTVKHPENVTTYRPSNIENHKNSAISCGGWEASAFKAKASRHARVTKQLEESLLHERREKIQRKRQAMRLLAEKNLRQRLNQRTIDTGDNRVADKEGYYPVDEQKHNRSSSITQTTLELDFQLTSFSSTDKSTSRKSTGSSFEAANATQLDDTATSSRKKRRFRYDCKRQIEISDNAAVNARLILDADIIFSICGHLDNPSYITSVRLTDLDLVDVKADELAQFTQLKRVEASDNHLQLEQLSCLPNLKYLELQANAISSIAPRTTHAFTHLIELNLSNNRLTGNDVQVLAEFPNLRNLDLSCNEISWFPMRFDNLSEPFPYLERINLSQNPLINGAVFAGCAGMSSLISLNLNQTPLTGIPILLPEGWDKDDDSQPLPFPSLRVLYMNHTHVQLVEDLLQCKFWPRLEELHLIDTPFSRKYRGIPRSIQTTLCLSKGVRVLTKQPTMPARGGASALCAVMTKVDTRLPEIKVANPVLCAAPPVPITPQLPSISSSNTFSNVKTGESQLLDSGKTIPVQEASKRTPETKKRGDLTEKNDHPETDKDVAGVPIMPQQVESAGKHHDSKNSQQLTESNDHSENGNSFFLTALDVVEEDEYISAEDVSAQPPASCQGSVLSVLPTFKSSTFQKQLPSISICQADLHIPQAPVFCNLPSFREYQQSLHRPPPTVEQRAFAEAQKLMGYKLEEKSTKLKTQQRTTDEILQFLSKLKEKEPDLGDEISQSVPPDILKYRGFEELLVDDDSDEVADERDAFTQCCIDNCPSSSLRAAIHALQHALDNPLRPTLKACQNLLPSNLSHDQRKAFVSSMTHDKCRDNIRFTNRPITSDQEQSVQETKAWREQRSHQRLAYLENLLSRLQHSPNDELQAVPDANTL